MSDETSGGSLHPAGAYKDAPAKDAPGALTANGIRYLRKMLANINVMLDYASSRGIPISSELRAKLDRLMNHPDLDKYGLRGASADH